MSSHGAELASLLLLPLQLSAVRDAKKAEVSTAWRISLSLELPNKQIVSFNRDFEPLQERLQVDEVMMVAIMEATTEMFTTLFTPEEGK